jgi:hypothetical protein
MNVDWSVWRPILAGCATLQEVELHWSIDDLADANEALDIKHEAENYAAKSARNK